jgi:hypothetical protein
MQNYNYLVLSPVKKSIKDDDKSQLIGSDTYEKFRYSESLKKNVTESEQNLTENQNEVVKSVMVSESFIFDHIYRMSLTRRFYN